MSDFDFYKLSPQYSIVYLPMDGQFRQDVGNNLFADGDMDKAGTSDWATGGGPVLAKETVGAYEGSQWMSMTGASGVLFKPNPNVANIGYQYHWIGVGHGDGITSPRIWNGAYLWLGSSIITWQLYDIIFTATSAECRFYNVGVAGLVGFDANYLYEHPQVIRSLSLQTGSNNYARLGDGHTASTMPLQLKKRGLSFDGGDYINLDWSVGSALDTQTFTFICDAKPSTPVADDRLYEIGIAGQRYSLYFDLSEGKLTCWKDDTVDETITTTKGYPDGQNHIYAFSFSVNGMNLYVDGELEGSISGDVRLASFNASTVAYIGQDVAAGNKYNGKIYSAAIYPFELNQAQIKECGRRMIQMRNI